MATPRCRLCGEGPRDCPHPDPRARMSARFQRRHHPVNAPLPIVLIHRPQPGRRQFGVAVGPWQGPAESGCDPRRRRDRDCRHQECRIGPRRALGCGALSCPWLVRLPPDLRFAGSRARCPRRLQGRRPQGRAGCAADARLVARLPLERTHDADGGGADRQSRHRGCNRAFPAGRCAGAHRRRAAVAEPVRYRAGDLFAHLRLERERPQQWRPRDRQLSGLAQREL